LDLHWQKCQHCSHFFVWPVVSDATLAKAYASVYAQQAKLARSAARSKLQVAFIKRRAPQGFFSAGELVMAELGCARGTLFNELEEHAKTMHCLDADPRMRQEGLARRDKLVLENVINIDDSKHIGDGQVDLWLGSHVIEHVAEPCRFFRSFARTMKPGALLFHEFPSGRDRDVVVREHTPHLHLSYFSLASFVSMGQAFDFVLMGVEVRGDNRQWHDIGDVDFNWHAPRQKESFLVLRVLMQYLPREHHYHPRIERIKEMLWNG
jgi:SAM-dependent methyltransferase